MHLFIEIIIGVKNISYLATCPIKRQGGLSAIIIMKASVRPRKFAWNLQ